MSEKFNIRSFPYFRSRICTNWAKNEIPVARGLKTKSKKLAERKVNKNCFFQKCIYFPSFILLQQEGFLIAPTLKGMLLKRGAGSGERGTSTGNGKIKKWEQNRELEMKLLIGLGIKLGFVPILHFPGPVPRFSNITLKVIFEVNRSPLLDKNNLFLLAFLHTTVFMTI